MNTKRRKTGARLGAMLLSLCLIVGLLPMTAFAQDTGTTIFGYEGSGNTWSMASVSAEDQSDYTALTSYDSFDWFYGLEMIGDTIYGVYSSYYNSSYDSELVILNPDLTIQETVGGWLNSSLDIEQIVDTTVQNGTLWGTYNTAEYEYSLEGGELVSIFKSGTSYLIPIDLTTGQPDTSRKVEVTGLPDREIIYAIACNESGQMYAIVADGGENGGFASLYTIDTTTFAANKVGDTGVTTNYVSSSTFAPDGTLYWAENNAGKLYTVNTDTGRVTAVPGGTIGGSGLSLNAMMIPSDTATTAYVNFVVNGEGTVTMNGQKVSGWQKVTPGDDLSLIFTPNTDRNVKGVVVDGEKMEFIDSYTLKNVSVWSAGTHTVEVTFGSRDISINADRWETPYLGTATLEYNPSFEATLYFTVSNGPSRNTAGVSNYQISIEKDGKTINKSDLVPGTYDIHVTRAEDEYWNVLDIVLKDDLIITKQTDLIQWSDLELTANPGDTLANIEKPAYLVSPLDGKQIPGTFYWVDDESTSVGKLGDRTGFKFRFVPDMPLSAELASLYDFSGMPENGFDGTETNPNYPFTAYVTVKEASDIPGDTTPIDLPVRVLEDEESGYVSRPDLTAAFTPDTVVTAGEFNEYQGLAIDYYNPMVDAQLSEGYDIQAEYTVSIPLTDYEGETLSGTLTIPLPQGYDGATARIKGGASASSYTATTVTFPLTLDVSGNTAEAFELLIEYKAQTGGSDQTGSDTTPQRPDRNGGGGSSSLYQDRELDFWEDVKSNLEDAEPGDTVKANARTYDRMPWSVMEALSEADGVTLHITWNGGEDIIIPSEAALSEQSRVYYPLSYLEEMTFEVEPEVPAADLDKINPETGGILTETPELAEKGIEQPLPGVYEPEEATASPAEETGTNGLLIASAVVALAAAGGGFWYWKRRTVR